MHVSIVNNSGSGSLASTSVETYSYSEDVTSLEPSEITGGTGQVNFASPGVYNDKVGNTHPNSLLLVNNTMTLTDEARGSIEFQVKQVSSTDEVVSVIGDTLQARLNVEKTALPHGGDTANLLTAIQYYCGLVDIFPAIDGELETELQAIPVNFIGWRGNVWEYLKMLCAGVSLSDSDNIGLEMYIDINELVFRKAKQVAAVYSNEIESQTISINSFEAAQEVGIYNYSTSYQTNGIVRDLAASVSAMGYDPNAVSIADTMQVDAGETITKRFNINASLVSVNQPVCVSTISPYPYNGVTGQYVIVGSDNLPISPSQWVDLGGKLTISLTENPGEIEVSVTAPSVPAIIHNSGSGEGLAPYKIGVEETDGEQYPAFYVTGTGVFFDKRKTTLKTGASSTFTSKSQATEIDNPFITKASDLAIRGVAAAQRICGPSVQLTESVVKPLAFGETPGTMRTVGSNKYRITAAQYSAEVTSITAIAAVNFSEFDAEWADRSFSDFKGIALDPTTYPDETLKFNEFTIIPLMKSA